MMARHQLSHRECSTFTYSHVCRYRFCLRSQRHRGAKAARRTDPVDPPRAVLMGHDAGERNLTEFGKTLWPILRAMRKWGNAFVERSRLLRQRTGGAPVRLSGLNGNHPRPPLRP
jgi:hypothetical protein